MVKKIIIGTSIIAILICIVAVLFQNNKISSNSKKLADVNIVPVENIAFNPSNYPDSIGIKGTVNQIVDDKTFLLGCQDACVSVPIKYNGKTPDLGQEVIIYGKLSEQNGKYVFLAEMLK